MFSENDSWILFTLLAAILHLGNLRFQGNMQLCTVFFVLFNIFRTDALLLLPLFFWFSKQKVRLLPKTVVGGIESD